MPDEIAPPIDSLRGDGPSSSASTATRLASAPEEIAAAVLNGDRTMLARAITCIESETRAHQLLARELLRHLLPKSGRAFRIGITGVPGAGKSTFIEAFGLHLCELGHKVAVLAVDPSSTLSRGSILGDKTRMEDLAKHPDAFIRPSPTGGALGGVARKTRETVHVCEAAGFDVVLIETVGVGQSEVQVRAMVDFLLLLGITGAGDELQAFKRGIVELADGILITKADGDNIARAEAARQEYETVLRYLQPATEGWTPFVSTCSALTGAGIPGAWKKLEEFRHAATASGVLPARRQRQMIEAFNAWVDEALRARWLDDPAVADVRSRLAARLLAGEIDLASAVETLLAALPSPTLKRE